MTYSLRGSLPIMLEEPDKVIVVVANLLYELPAGAGWIHKGAIIDLVVHCLKPEEGT